MLLRNTSKNSLLLASRFGIPFGYVMVVPMIFFNLAALFHPAIEQPPYPVAILILLALPATLVCLMLMHRAVNHELKNRENEPSHFRKTLLKTILFGICGSLCWVILFCAAFFVLSRWTTLQDENVLIISVALSILLITLCGVLLARKDITSGSRSASHPDIDPD